MISRTGFGYVAKVGEVILTGGKKKKKAQCWNFSQECYLSLDKYLLLAEFSVRTVNYGPSILGTGHCVCLEVVSIFPPFVFAKKTLQKAKKLFKVSLLSLSKDSLVNCFWENLSFCQFILVFNCDLR